MSAPVFTVGQEVAVDPRATFASGVGHWDDEEYRPGPFHVTHPEPDGAGDVYLRDGEGDTRYAHFDYVHPVTEEPKFKPGDVVTVSANATYTVFGDEGNRTFVPGRARADTYVVEGGPDPDGDYELVDPDGEIIYAAEWFLSHENDTQIVNVLDVARGVDEQRVLTADPVDWVNHPPHYQTESGLEAADVIEAFGLGWHLGSATKYILRAGKKGDFDQDIDKAIWFLERAKRTKREETL